MTLMVTNRTQLHRADRRRVRTRRALLKAGQALFAKRAIEAVSIDDIVLAADVAKGSFYNHFADKVELAGAVADQVRGAVEALVAEANAGIGDPAERVARALCTFARQASEHPERVRALIRLFDSAGTADGPMDRGVRADIADGMAAGRFSGLGLEAGVLMAVGVVHITVLRLLARETPASPAALAQDLAFALLRGLGVASAEAVELAARAVADVIETRPGAGQ